AGAARYAFNWALAAVKVNIGQRAAERSYGVAEEQLTPALGWSLPALRRVWNQAKGEVAPWWAECSKESYNTGLDGVARALRPGHRPGPQRRDQPPAPRRPEWPGDAKRTWSRP
ncbi:MAG: putative transposase, partial [Micromonosporaceae bacterium]|nr:putative transposase [Micromonosporaceae bacterium]